jgi:hypothetical protein
MTQGSPSPGFKQKAKEEFRDFIRIALYLAAFFCALVLYTRLTLRAHGVPITSDTVNFSLAIVNALVIGKVILIGEWAQLGKSAHTKPLYQTVLIKTLLFGLLLFAFHLVEEFVKRLIRGEPFGTAIHEVSIYEMLARAIIVLLAFLPLFAYHELRRVLGPEKIHEIFLAPRGSTDPALPARSESGHVAT